MVKPSGLTTLGRIGAVHGVKGWVRLISFTDPAENLLDFSHFYLGPGASLSADSPDVGEKPQALEQIEIDESRMQGKHFIGHIKGVDDREEARLYTGRDLQIETQALPGLEREEFYWFQLEGLKVINQQGEILGTVHHLLETGANDVLVVRATAESIDGQERLIPWVRDQVVLQVDLDQGVIKVDWEKDF